MNPPPTNARYCAETNDYLIMRKIVLFGAVVAVCLVSCVRITEVPREEPPEPSDTMIVDGWDEVDTIEIVHP